jgi:amino acid transporter
MPITDGADNKDTEHSLRANALGIGAVTFFVVSAAGPLIAMAGGLPVAMLLGNGAGIPAMFLLAAVILLAFAAGFTAMSVFVKNAGGFYAFAARGLGGYAAGATAAVAIFSYSALQIGIYGLFGAATRDLIASYGGVAIPWWICSFLAMGVIGVLGYRQVDLSAKLLCVLVISEYLVVLILDVAVLRSPGIEMSAVAFTPGVIASGAPWIGLLMCFTAFIGFEATTIYAEEARDPQRTIPIATYASLLLIGIFYVFSSWCMVVAVGHDKLMPMLTALPDPTNFVFVLSDRHVGPLLTAVMRVLFITSTFAALLAFHNSLARYFFALGREGLLSKSLSRTHAVNRSPYIASFLQTATAAIAVLLFVIGEADPIAVLFARVSAVGTLGIIALMAIASCAVAAFFRGRPGNLWRVRVLPAVSALALIYIFALGWLHFDALAGGMSPLIPWLPLLVIAAAALGWALSYRLRLHNHADFKKLGGVTL